MTPPDQFGGIECFNELLAQEIVHNPGLRSTNAYGLYRTEQLNTEGARAFPALAKFIAEFPRRGLDAVLPPAPSEGFLWSAGTVVREEEGHRSHLQKFAYVSGVYHVAVLQTAGGAQDRAGAPVYPVNARPHDQQRCADVGLDPHPTLFDSQAKQTKSTSPFKALSGGGIGRVTPTLPHSAKGGFRLARECARVAQRRRKHARAQRVAQGGKARRIARQCGGGLEILFN